MTDTRRIPWIRLASEGAVIVASILLAFAVDAWWEDRGETERPAAFVELLEADLTTNVEGLDAAIAELDRRVPQIAALVNAIQPRRSRSSASDARS